MSQSIRAVFLDFAPKKYFDNNCKNIFIYYCLRIAVLLTLMKKLKLYFPDAVLSLLCGRTDSLYFLPSCHWKTALYLKWLCFIFFYYFSLSFTFPIPLFFLWLGFARKLCYYCKANAFTYYCIFCLYCLSVCAWLISLFVYLFGVF